MKYFALLTFLIFASYLLGFIKKPEKYQWMDRNYTTAIKGYSILTVVWAHSGAMLSVGGIQFIAGIGVALFLMCSGYGVEVSYEKSGLIGFWKKRLLGVCLPFWVVELVGLFGAFGIWFVVESVFFANPDMPFLRARQMLSFPAGVLLAINKDKIERTLTKAKNILILTGGGVQCAFSSWQ